MCLRKEEYISVILSHFEDFYSFTFGTEMQSKLLTLNSVVFLIKILVFDMFKVLNIQEGIQLDITFSEMKLEF